MAAARERRERLGDLLGEFGVCARRRAVAVFGAGARAGRHQARAQSGRPTAAVLPVPVWASPMNVPVRSWHGYGLPLVPSGVE